MSAMVLVLIAKLCATMIAAVKLSTKKLILAIMTVRQTQAVKMVFVIVMKVRDHWTIFLAKYLKFSRLSKLLELPLWIFRPDISDKGFESDQFCEQTGNTLTCTLNQCIPPVNDECVCDVECNFRSFGSVRNCAVVCNGNCEKGAVSKEKVEADNSGSFLKRSFDWPTNQSYLLNMYLS